VISSLSYRAFGATSVVSYGNGRRLWLGYDTNRHQMVSMLVDNQNGTDRIIDKTYHYTTQSSQQTYYDNDGRIKKIADNLDPNYTATYTYDAYNRLSSASGGSYGSTYYRSYSYDPWGNLGAVFTSPDNLNATSYSVALATNRVNSVTTQLYGWAAQTVNYTWDAAGNLTNDGLRTYTYDAAGRQKEAGAVGQNTVGYDGDGQRVRKIENWGTPIYYVRSSVLKQAAMEVVGGTLARAYVYVDGLPVAELASDGQFYWVHKDHLGTGRKLIDTSGAVVYRGEFDPHGQPLLETGSALLNSHKYTGYERDQATGLDYAEARMYQSNTGRFTSPDPLGLGAADLKRPQSLNRYSYVENDPVNFYDPDGMIRCGDIPVVSGGTVSDFLRADSDYGRLVRLVWHEGGTVCPCGKAA
jgi:RHS repeat-associated protein